MRSPALVPGFSFSEAEVSRIPVWDEYDDHDAIWADYDLDLTAPEYSGWITAADLATLLDDEEII